MNLKQIIHAVKTELENVPGLDLSVHTYPDRQQGIAVRSDGALVAVVVSTCPHALWRAVRQQVRQVFRAEREVDSIHDKFSLTTILNEGGEHCRNCSTSEYPIWRVLRGREIERCPHCSDEAYDVYDFAEDDPY